MSYSKRVEDVRGKFGRLEDAVKVGRYGDRRHGVVANRSKKYERQKEWTETTVQLIGQLG